MTISNSTTPTKESILDKWNVAEQIIESGRPTTAINEIENRIIELLERDYFVESVQKRKSYQVWDGVEDALSDEEKRELKLYREIFEWDESFELHSSWESRGYTDQVNDTHEFDEPYTLADVKKIIESINPIESLSEPDKSDYWTDVEMQSFEAKIVLDELRLRKIESTKRIKEQLSVMSERIHGESGKYQSIINEMRSHKDDPSYHFEDIEHLFHLFNTIPICLVDLCNQLAKLEEEN